MKRRLLLLFYALMSILGIFRVFYWLNRYRRSQITFHNVLPDALLDGSPDLGMCHPVSVFECQVALIGRRMELSAINEGPYGPLITFDDGYINQGEVAAPILEKHGMRGQFFVPLESIENGVTLAVDQLQMWASYAPPGTYQLLGQTWQIDDADRPALCATLFQELLRHPQQWNTLSAQLDQAFPLAQLALPEAVRRLRFVPLDGPALKALAARGHHIACHSWDHHPLALLPDDLLQSQMRQCWEQHGQHCNDHGFCYPFGRPAEVSPAVARACKEAGFSHAFLCTPTRPSHYAGLETFALPRISLPCLETHTFILDAKLSGFETFVKRILRSA